MLGLFREPKKIAARILLDRSITADSFRTGMRVIPVPEADMPALIPFAPTAKKAIEMVLREALRLGHNYVGTEHVLLGVLAEGTGPGATILSELGVDHESIDAAVREILSTYTAE